MSNISVVLLLILFMMLYNMRLNKIYENDTNSRFSIASSVQNGCTFVIVSTRTKLFLCQVIRSCRILVMILCACNQFKNVKYVLNRRKKCWNFVNMLDSTLLPFVENGNMAMEVHRYSHFMSW